MCRILGAIGRELDSPFISNVFLESEHLGRDATGFWFPTTNIVKGAKKVSEFLPEVKDAFEEGIRTSHIFIGHTRLATHGKPEFNYNNHPIESENWIVVHNGIVHMKDIKEYPYTTDTDTENILAYIETFGLEKGLEYCFSGASIILVNKNEENTLYVWRTATGDMALAYDFDRENIYISSGSKYFYSALKPEIEEIERLGGLFTSLGRRMKIKEPPSRELWRISYRDALLKAEKVADIFARGVTGGYWQGNTYCAGYAHWREKDDEDSKLFTELCYGNNRPAIREGRLEVKDNNTTTTNANQNTSKRSVTKPTNGHGIPLFEGDIVRFKRAIRPTDTVNSAKPALLMKLHTGMEFKVTRFLTDTRVVLSRTDGEIFVSPRHLLEIVDNPYCLGICYSGRYERCKSCLFKETCLDVYDAYKDIPKPPCIGKYDTEDDDCVKCTFVTHCLSRLGRREDYIDAQFKEVNEATTGETK